MFYFSFYAKAVKSVVLTLGRYARTVRFLRPVQVYGRLWFRLYRPRPDLRAAPGRRQPRARLADPPYRAASLVGADTFVFLNRERTVSTCTDWSNITTDTLWLYNLHYFDDLKAQNAAERRGWHEALMRRWVKENPPGQSIGWEPYPTSLRIVNWVQWALRSGKLPAVAEHSLAVQARWLRRRLEYHLLGNHLFANANALVFAGLFFQGGEAQSWLRKGLALVEREIAEQVLSDGGHFERSPMYHLIVLEDCLDLLNVHDAYGVDRPKSLIHAADAMSRWAALMQHPDGGIPFFNDAAFGIAPEPAAILDYAARLGIATESVELKGVNALPASGYVRLLDDGATVFFDAGPVGPDYLPGHAHADTLSVEASFYGERVLVNSGTSVYGRGGERQWQRSTAAHNTITVDGADSSEVWSGFRVARRANVRGLMVDYERGCASAWHDGFARLAGEPCHRRSIELGDSVLTVNDDITGDGAHTVTGRWYLHPKVEVVSVDGKSEGFSARLQVSAPHEVITLELTITGADSVTIEDATFHPRFGVSRSNKVLVFAVHGLSPARLCTRLALNTELKAR